jgi:hypothetical protein
MACALSYPIPNRFTSASVMTVAAPLITEDPLATLPAVIPAAAFLRQMEPEVLSYQSLSKIIQDPGLNLYSTERSAKPMEDVVRNMLDNDLRIVPLEHFVLVFRPV